MCCLPYIIADVVLNQHDIIHIISLQDSVVYYFRG